MRPSILISIALAVVIIAIYWQVGNHQFLTFDDDLYVTGNVHVRQGLTAANLVWAFTAVEQCNWHPLTWLSHLLDVQLFGMNPGAHHLMNVLYHTVATVLLFTLLLRLTGALWRSCFVAALFALHPTHVESVAWVAERKDTLSAGLAFLSLLFYARYAETRHNNAATAPVFYALALGAFVLGLMAKPMVVTLPVVMLLLDYWPLRRIGAASSIVRLGAEKIPFIICSIFSAVITLYAQRLGGAVMSLEWIPWSTRVQNALVAYGTYMVKTLWPQDLAVLYPLSLPIPLWQTIFAGGALLLITLTVIWLGRRYQYLPVGWFWFLITLVPVIGLVQVGNQAMADRYTYIPAIGLYLLVAWGVPDLVRVTRHPDIVPDTPEVRTGFRPAILTLLAVIVLVIAATLTLRQIGHWQNDFTLYRHTLAVTSGNYIINYNLGVAYGRAGNFPAAIKEFQTAVMIKPTDNKLRNMLAATLADNGNIPEAIAEYRKALVQMPNDPQASSALEYWGAQRSQRTPGM